MFEVGLNLKCLSKYLKDHKTIVETCSLLKDMGYSYLEFDGTSFDVIKIQKIIDESKINICLTNISIDKFLARPLAFLKEHGFIGCHNIGLSSMSLELIKDEKKCKNIIKELNDIASIAINNNFKLFYHFSLFDFLQFKDGTVIIDYILENAPLINFVFDPYFVHLAGYNVNDFIVKLKNRIDCFYLKNYQISLENGNVSINPASLSNGTFNIKEMLSLAKKTGAKYFFVVNENNQVSLHDIQKNIESFRQIFK